MFRCHALQMKEPLRIGFATPEYVTEKYFDGGLANYTYRVARALAQMGHDIHVVTLSEIDEAQFHHDGVTVHRVANSKWCAGVNGSTRATPTVPRALDLSFTVYRKLKFLNSLQPFHLLQFPNYSCCGLFSIALLRVPHVLRASSYQPALLAALGAGWSVDSTLMNGLEALQFHLSRNIFVPSSNLQRVLASQGGLERARVINSPFYLEISDFDSSVYDQC
jgi:hypothetical protein